MVERGKMRPGREWEKGDKVCPHCHAERGLLVEGEIVMVTLLQHVYRPPSLRQWQLNAYIVEWPAGYPMAPLARGFGIFLGDELLTYEEAHLMATHVLSTERTRLIDESGIETRVKAAEAFKFRFMKRT